MAWALRTGGTEVRRALAEAEADVIAELDSISGDAPNAFSNELRATVLREVVLPCSMTLLSASAAGQLLQGRAA